MIGGKLRRMTRIQPFLFRPYVHDHPKFPNPFPQHSFNICGSRGRLNNHSSKVGLMVTQAGPHHLSRSTQSTQRRALIAYLALHRRQSRYAGLYMGKALKEKRNTFFFSFETFSHKAVSNRIPYFVTLCTLWARVTEGHGREIRTPD